jgi:hypothetical protein
MKARKLGRRHFLILYQRTMNRLWPSTFLLGLLLIAMWWWSGDIFPSLAYPFDPLVLAGGIILEVFALLIFLIRNMAYVQAGQDNLRVITPFLRLKISYRRVRIVRPVEFQQLFPPQKAGWAQRRFLQPFYGQTVLVVDLHDYPLRPGLLRLFLHRTMFSPQGKGLVFVVKDWMGLSTELANFQGIWLQKVTLGPKSPSSQSLLQNLKKK